MSLLGNHICQTCANVQRLSWFRGWRFWWWEGGGAISVSWHPGGWGCCSGHLGCSTFSKRQQAEEAVWWMAAVAHNKDDGFLGEVGVIENLEATAIFSALCTLGWRASLHCLLLRFSWILLIPASPGLLAACSCADISALVLSFILMVSRYC